MKTFNVEDGCNVTVTALRNTRRCVALFRPRATCTNLMVTCDKFYLPNEDEARCRQVACRDLLINEISLNFLNICFTSTNILRLYFKEVFKLSRASSLHT